MPRAKCALAEVDPNAQASVSKKSSKGEANKRPKNATFETNDNSNKNNTMQLKFISLCRPPWDVEAERRDKEDEEEEGDNEQDMCTADCVCKDPANDRPGWTWVMSEEGLKMYKKLEKQAFNRDQDAQGLYIYNDYTAYGINEVVDNWLKDFNKEVSKKTVSPFAVWAQLESISMFLQLDYVDIWFGGDDSHGFAETIALVGRALLTGLHLLKIHQLLKPYQPEKGRLRNISIVLAMFIEFARKWTDIGGDQFGETKWVPKVGKIAKENSIEIKGPYKFHEHNQKILEPEPEKDTASDDKPKEKKKRVHLSHGTWGIATLVDVDSDDEDPLAIKDGDYSVKGWKKSFKTYTQDHAIDGRKTIGGTVYDITKISKAGKKQFELEEG